VLDKSGALNMKVFSFIGSGERNLRSHVDVISSRAYAHLSNYTYGLGRERLLGIERGDMT
jgi:hypothetical protein